MILLGMLTSNIIYIYIYKERNVCNINNIKYTVYIHIDTQYIQDV